MRRLQMSKAEPERRRGVKKGQGARQSWSWPHCCHNPHSLPSRHTGLVSIPYNLIPQLGPLHFLPSPPWNSLPITLHLINILSSGIN